MARFWRRPRSLILWMTLNKNWCDPSFLWGYFTISIVSTMKSLGLPVFSRRSHIVIISDVGSSPYIRWIITSMSQKFCNILITRCTIRKLRVLLPISWRSQSTLKSERLSSPDALCATHRICFSDSGRSHGINAFWKTWSPKFLKPEQNYLVTALWSTARITFRTIDASPCFYGVVTQFELIKHKRLSNQKQGKEMLNM